VSLKKEGTTKDTSALKKGNHKEHIDLKRRGNHKGHNGHEGKTTKEIQPIKQKAVSGFLS
jgi:hypothetical protein